MKNYKFKYLDQDGDNEYKVFFDVSTEYVDLHECSLEVDGEIYLEDHNGNEVNFKDLSKIDQDEILDQVEAWLDSEQMENGYNYYQDDIDAMADYFYDGLEDR